MGGALPPLGGTGGCCARPAPGVGEAAAPAARAAASLLLLLLFLFLFGCSRGGWGREGSAMPGRSAGGPGPPAPLNPAPCGPSGPWPHGTATGAAWRHGPCSVFGGFALQEPGPKTVNGTVQEGLVGPRKAHRNKGFCLGSVVHLRRGCAELRRHNT